MNDNEDRGTKNYENEPKASFGHPRYKEILDRMWKLHEDKARQYGSDADPLANLRNGERFGMPAWKRCLVEADSAFYRTENFCNGRNEGVESLKNALMDAAAFSLLALLFIEEDQDSSGFEKTREVRQSLPDQPDEWQEKRELWNDWAKQESWSPGYGQNTRTCMGVVLDPGAVPEATPSPPKSNGVAMADALFTGVFGMKRVDPPVSGYRASSPGVSEAMEDVLKKAT